MAKKDNSTEPEPMEAGGKTPAEEAPEDSGKKETRLQQLKNKVREDDPKPSPTLTLRKIIGGDILTAEMVRSQMGLFALIVLFTISYVAARFQCQQDIIEIDRLERELKDAKYKALSSSSALTERCRESHVLEILRNNKDSLLHIAEQPPYIIITEE